MILICEMNSTGLEYGSVAGNSKLGKGQVS